MCFAYLSPDKDIDLREKIIQLLLKYPPMGDLKAYGKNNKFKISCVFVFYKRMDLMENILHCLNSQNFEKDSFEVVLVEDKGGSETGQNFINQYPELNIFYHAASEDGWGKIGYLRNLGLSKSRGKYVLFLDDDTVINDETFLEKLDTLFSNDNDLQAVVPRGQAAFSIIEGKYSYHDPFYLTNRCVAYRRSCLNEMGGFDSNFIGQEDVEFAIRFTAKGFKLLKTDTLNYYHPPLVYNDLSKGKAVGASFANAKYGFLMKLLLFINGTRWLPLIVIPKLKYRYMGMFAAGFAIGFIQTVFFVKGSVEYS